MMAVSHGDGVRSRLGGLFGIASPASTVSIINKNVDLTSYQQSAYLRPDNTNNRIVGSLPEREDLFVELLEKNALLENIKAVEDYHDLMKQAINGTARAPEELEQFHESCVGLVLKYLREHISHHGTRSIALKSIGAMLQREFEKFKHENGILVQAFGTRCKLEKNRLLHEFEKQLRNTSANFDKQNSKSNWPGLEHISAMFCDATKNGPQHVSEPFHKELKKEGGVLLEAACKAREMKICGHQCNFSDCEAIKKIYRTKMNNMISQRICDEKELNTLHSVVLCELASRSKHEAECGHVVSGFGHILEAEKAKVFGDMHQRLDKRCQAVLSECQPFCRGFLVEAAQDNNENPFEKGWVKIQAKFRHNVLAGQFESTVFRYELQLREVCQGIFQDLEKDHQGHKKKQEKIIEDAAEKYKLFMTDRIKDTFVDSSVLVRANESFSNLARAYLKEESGDSSWEKYLPCLNETLAIVFDDIKDGNEQKRIDLERRYVVCSRECLSLYQAWMLETCDGTCFTDTELLMQHGNAVIRSLQKFDEHSTDNFQQMYNDHRKSLADQFEQQFTRFKIINDVNKEHLQSDVDKLLRMIRDAYWRHMDECLERNVTSRYDLLKKHHECMNSAEASTEESGLAKRKDSNVFREGLQKLSLALYDEVQTKYAFFLEDSNSKFMKVKTECLLKYKRWMDEQLSMKFYTEENLEALHEEAKAACEVDGSNVPMESNLCHGDISLIDGEIESLFCLYKVSNYSKTAETKGRCLDVIRRYQFKYSIILDKALEGKWFGRIDYLKYVHTHAKVRLLQNAEVDCQNLDADFLVTELISQLDEGAEELFVAKVDQLKKWDIATSSTAAWISTFANICGKAALGLGAKAVGLLGYASSPGLSDDS